MNALHIFFPTLAIVLYIASLVISRDGDDESGYMLMMASASVGIAYMIVTVLMPATAASSLGG